MRLIVVGFCVGFLALYGVLLLILPVEGRYELFDHLGELGGSETAAASEPYLQRHGQREEYPIYSPHMTADQVGRLMEWNAEAGRYEKPANVENLPDGLMTIGKLTPVFEFDAASVKSSCILRRGIGGFLDRPSERHVVTLTKEVRANLQGALEPYLKGKSRAGPFVMTDGYSVWFYGYGTEGGFFISSTYAAFLEKEDPWDFMIDLEGPQKEFNRVSLEIFLKKPLGDCDKIQIYD